MIIISIYRKEETKRECGRENIWVKNNLSQTYGFGRYKNIKLQIWIIYHK